MKSPSVVVVEDDPLNRILIEEMLRIAGIERCKVVEGGQTILEDIESMLPVGAILLDLQLPVEDGYSIHSRIRFLPQLAGIPIVAVTAQVMPDDIARAQEAGFHGFLGKPLRFDQFPGQITRIMSGELVWEP